MGAECPVSFAQFTIFHTIFTCYALYADVCEHEAPQLTTREQQTDLKLHPQKKRKRKDFAVERV